LLGDKEKKLPRGFAQRATTPEHRASLAGSTPVTLKVDVSNEQLKTGYWHCNELL
jgi:hypothetical protein